VLAVFARRLPAEERPNVILVMTDDQGYGDLSCHGNALIETPNLDRLYAQSVRFTDFHVDPTCSPTRAALLTGRYSPRTGVWHTIQGRSLLHRDEVTVADLFVQAGYRTGIFGKWHLGDNFPFRPEYRGFQESLVCGGGGIEQTPDAWGNTYFDAALRQNGKLVSTKGYCTAVFFDAALEFIDRHRDKPFFLYLPTNVPHGPFEVPEADLAHYRRKGLRDGVALFYGMITNFDRHLGRLLDRLDSSGLTENTLLIFLTDNGSTVGAFNVEMRGRKGSHYDGGHRVPFFVRWPKGFTGGRNIDRLTAHIDVLPTLAEICSLPLPADVPLDGRSLAKLLAGGRDWPDRTLFVQSHRIEHPKPYRKSAVLTQRHRLVGGVELYDIVNDPSQEKDLATKQPELAATLRAAYDAWYASCATRFEDYCRIVLGAPEENPTTLTAHDWHGEKVPWNHGHVERQIEANGFWAVDVARSGTYRLTLRAKPEVEAFPLGSGTVRLKVGPVEETQSVAGDVSAVSFTLGLEAGPARLQTWVEGDKGKRGAFYVEVERLDG